MTTAKAAAGQRKCTRQGGEKGWDPPETTGMIDLFRKIHAIDSEITPSGVAKKMSEGGFGDDWSQMRISNMRARFGLKQYSFEQWAKEKEGGNCGRRQRP